jgi:hypothetical protein
MNESITIGWSFWVATSIGACVVIGLIMYLSKKKKFEDLE